MKHKHTVWRVRQHPPTFLRLALLAGAGGTRMQQPHYLSPLGALMACIRSMFNYTVAVTLRSRTRVLSHLSDSAFQFSVKTLGYTMLSALKKDS